MVEEERHCPRSFGVPLVNIYSSQFAQSPKRQANIHFVDFQNICNSIRFFAQHPRVSFQFFFCSIVSAARQYRSIQMTLRVKPCSTYRRSLSVPFSFCFVIVIIIPFQSFFPSQDKMSVSQYKFICFFYFAFRAFVFFCVAVEYLVPSNLFARVILITVPNVREYRLIFP